MKTNYTREELIALCDQAVVPQDRWRDRDSASAQRQLGEGRQLLLAGCPFVMSDDPATDERTVWIRITYQGFNYHEWGVGTDDAERSLDHDLCYIPTQARLDACKGKDWY